MADRWEKCLDCGRPMIEAPAGTWRCEACGREYGQMELITKWAARDLTAKWRSEEPQERLRFGDGHA